MICISTGLFAKTTKMETPAPVIDFQLPMFGKDGYKTWDLRGKEGFFKDENHIDIHGMFLKIYSGNEGCELDTTIESLQATLKPKENKAFGDDLIFVSGKNFNIIGKGWQWNGLNKKIAIKKDARVTFNQRLVSLAKD
ncbi:MAG: hypothetical protein CO175_05135 [Verrucomicrobia bacterium CG_4_9_14_3_um_filter_43_20]|nr:MAG: hypothetical protein AUJ82_06860 [Verrucomicrobia bacterium CG1_02_43_26]PIY61480.1 MAG: hypothetical protein COY94_05125 [Verrucomicrobia bacterium CG_4_10_14_0_8_um_filter_43_34]PJA43999.1 MAG: hypothetical protein CO175_05135 [Verrucomicrobia bacterium CG_4_9_14_3_um_filter_43_20]